MNTSNSSNIVNSQELAEELKQEIFKQLLIKMGDRGANRTQLRRFADAVGSGTSTILTPILNNIYQQGITQPQAPVSPVS